MVGEIPQARSAGALSSKRSTWPIYQAIAATDTPDLDRDFERLSRAADHSKLWIATAGALALTAGDRGRRAAVNGLAAVGATSAVVNLIAKPLGGRRRPDRETYNVPVARQVPMPRSTSFPSGHSASAFAFASGVADVLPAAVPLQLSAALVAYSRVHTGVHYPADVIVGALIGSAVAPLTSALLKRIRDQAPGGR